MKFISIVDPEKKTKKQRYFPKSFLELIPPRKNVLPFLNLDDFSLVQHIKPFNNFIFFPQIETLH